MFTSVLSWLLNTFILNAKEEVDAEVKEDASAEGITKEENDKLTEEVKSEESEKEEAVTEDGVLQVELQEGTQNGDTTHYVLTVTNFDVGRILEDEQYTRYSGPITLVFEEGLISDTSGNKNRETKKRVEGRANLAEKS